MSMRCTVCRHDKRLKIEKEIVKNVPNTKIGKTYGLNHQAVRCHKMNHLPRSLVKNEEIKEMLHSHNLLTDMKTLVIKTKTILNRAEKKGHSMISLAAIRELRSTYEFMCKMSVYLYEVQKEEEVVENKYDKQEEIRRLKRLSIEELELFRKLIVKMDGEEIDVISVTNEELSLEQRMYPKRKIEFQTNEKSSRFRRAKNV